MSVPTGLLPSQEQSREKDKLFRTVFTSEGGMGKSSIFVRMLDGDGWGESMCKSNLKCVRNYARNILGNLSAVSIIMRVYI